MLKLARIPLYALLRTRSLSGAVLVGLAANALQQLGCVRTGAERASRSSSLLLRGGPPWSHRGSPSCSAPYDLREMTMLGDSRQDTLGAVLGFRSVSVLTEGSAGARSRRSRASRSSANGARWAA